VSWLVFLFLFVLCLVVWHILGGIGVTFLLALWIEVWGNLKLSYCWPMEAGVIPDLSVGLMVLVLKLVVGGCRRLFTRVSDLGWVCVF
jgi:hypothetical protein